jgi:hypothetical protein
MDVLAHVKVLSELETPSGKREPALPRIAPSSR